MINNVRISRCLFYVSKILGQVIDNDGKVDTTFKKKRSRAHFFITEEQQKNLETSETLIYVRDITEEINRVTCDNVTRKMQYSWINNWLVSIGMLEIISEKRHATEQGIEIGIKTEKRHSDKIGEYYVNLFSPSAQAFIFDNIDSIVTFHYNNDNSNTQEAEG